MPVLPPHPDFSDEQLKTWEEQNDAAQRVLDERSETRQASRPAGIRRTLSTIFQKLTN